MIDGLKISFHFTVQWCQHVGKLWGPVNTSKQPNLSEVCFLALFLWL